MKYISIFEYSNMLISECNQRVLATLCYESATISVDENRSLDAIIKKIGLSLTKIRQRQAYQLLNSLA